MAELKRVCRKLEKHERSGAQANPRLCWQRSEFQERLNWLEETQWNNTISREMKPDLAEFDQLLSKVTHVKELSYVDGLEPIRRILERDEQNQLLEFLLSRLSSVSREVRRGLCFLLAQRFRALGAIEGLRVLYEDGDADAKAGVLNGLWDPGKDPSMHETILHLALNGTRHPAATVRTEACSVLMNIASYGVDIQPALPSLFSLVEDPSGRVRMHAVCAVGNVAQKRKCDLSGLLPALEENLFHADLEVRVYTAWALWKISRRHDIGRSIPRLLLLLACPDHDHQRAWKEASGAILHHARKSGQNLAMVKKLVKAEAFDTTVKERQRFLEQLAKL